MRRAVITSSLLVLSLSVGAGPDVLERRHGAIIDELRRQGDRAHQCVWFGARPASPARVEVGPVGVRFVDGAGAHLEGGRVYSHAVWVDAAGRRETVAVHARGDTLVFELDDALLARTTFPAVLDPWVGPELAADDPVLRAERDPSVVVWAGDRFVGTTSSGALFAVFEDAGVAELASLVDGGLPDPVFAIAASGTTVGMVSAHFGRQLAITWSPDAGLWVSSTLSPDAFEFAVTGEAAGFAAGWVEGYNDGGTVVRAVRFGPGWLGPTMTLGPAPADALPLGAATDGLSTWFAVASADGGVALREWQPDAGVSTQWVAGRPLMLTASRPGRALLASAQFPPDGGIELVGFVEPGGVPLPVIGLGAGLGYALTPTADATLAAVTSFGTAELYRIDDDGGVQHVGSLTGAKPILGSLAAGAHAGLLTTAVAAHETALLFPLDGGPAFHTGTLHLTANDELRQRLSASGDRLLLTFSDDRTATFDPTPSFGIYDENARPVLAPRSLSQVDEVRGFGTPQVARAGDGWVVTWSDVSQIFHVLVGRDGGVGDVVTSLPTGPFAYDPAASVLGDTVLVTWEDFSGLTWAARRFHLDGGAIDVSPLSLAEVGFLVSHDATDFIVLDVNQLATLRITPTGAPDLTKSFLSDAGVQCAALWCGDLECQVVLTLDDAGVVLAPLDGGAPTRALAAPVVPGECANLMYGGPDGLGLSWRLGDGGLLLVGYGSTGAPLGGPVTVPQVAVVSPRADGGFVIAYPVDTGLTHRVRLRVIAELPAGTPCTTPDACVSGFCADGVCCDEACGGSEPFDCFACSRLAGAPADGVCQASVAGALCRPPLDACDSPERCDGTALTCPPAVTTACAPDGGMDGGVDGGIDGGAPAEVDGGVARPRALQVGCGCEGAPGGWLALLALLAGVHARRQVRAGGT